MDVIWWLILFIILVVIEVVTVDLVTIWYIASCFVTMVVSIFTDSFLIQFSIFVLLGTLLLLTTRKTLLKLLKHDDVRTNLDRVIGTVGIVTEKIEKNSFGEVKADGKRWTAYSDEEIDVNTPVIIKKIEGVKIKVEKEGK